MSHQIIIKAVPKALKALLPAYLMEIEHTVLPSEADFVRMHAESGYHAGEPPNYFTQNHHVNQPVGGPFLVNGPLDTQHTWIDSPIGEGRNKRTIAALLALPHPTNPSNKILFAFLRKNQNTRMH
ncbi:hypothetical protein HY994_01120 [Candidatus Micrarchaeota archaeon]|nr:hypothetical protein [Candidatus Micrarchaeota archaeon]